MNSIFGIILKSNKPIFKSRDSMQEKFKLVLEISKSEKNKT